MTGLHLNYAQRRLSFWGRGASVGLAKKQSLKLCVYPKYLAINLRFGELWLGFLVNLCKTFKTLKSLSHLGHIFHR
jgi:hypothetical protein